MHGLLSVSSLIFHIPGVRNPTAPMIYPEYRMHSILFALRSIVCVFMHYYNMHVSYIIFTCYGTMILADITTYMYNDNNKNGTTMKNMPFGKNIPEHDQNRITLMQSSSQIAATIYMLGNINTAFSPMFAIQMAALLMTLVRKNIIKPGMWHILYAISLWVNAYFYICKSVNIDFIIVQIFMCYIYTTLFFKIRLNKYVGWTILFGLFYWKQTMYPQIIGHWIDTNMFEKYEIYFRYFIFLGTFAIYIPIMKSLYFEKNIE